MGYRTFVIEINANSYIAFLIHDPYLNTPITKKSRFLIGGLKKQFLTFELGGKKHYTTYKQISSSIGFKKRFPNELTLI